MAKTVSTPENYFKIHIFVTYYQLSVGLMYLFYIPICLGTHENFPDKRVVRGESWRSISLAYNPKLGWCSLWQLFCTDSLWQAVTLYSESELACVTKWCFVTSGVRPWEALLLPPCHLNVLWCQHEGKPEKVQVDFTEEEMEKWGQGKEREKPQKNMHTLQFPGVPTAACSPGTPDCNTHGHHWPVTTSNTGRFFWDGTV